MKTVEGFAWSTYHYCFSTSNLGDLGDLEPLILWGFNVYESLEEASNDTSYFAFYMTSLSFTDIDVIEEIYKLHS